MRGSDDIIFPAPSESIEALNSYRCVTVVTQQHTGAKDKAGIWRSVGGDECPHNPFEFVFCVHNEYSSLSSSVFSWLSCLLLSIHRLVIGLKDVLEKAIFSVASKSQRLLAQVSCHFETLVRAVNVEDETMQSTRVFYLLSLIFVISLILLSPDKIPQILTHAQADSELLGKAQDIAKVFRKLVPV